MSKVLITSGCSFSECIHYENPAFKKNWPIHLAESLKEFGYTEHISLGLPSQGNGLISRGIIYNVIEALKKYKPEDILVGVMWSGSNRHDYRCQNPEETDFVTNNVHNNVYQNPTQFVKGADKKWIILNVNWVGNNKEAELYYRHFYDDIGNSIISLEHILKTQLFLQSKGVPYFFTNYVDHNIVYPSLLTEVEIKYLLEELDLTYYLPVTSEFQWLVNNDIRCNEWDDLSWKRVWTCVDEFGRLYEWNNWLHPTANQHKEFVDRIIIPWLKEKYAGIVFNG